MQINDYSYWINADVLSTVVLPKMYIIGEADAKLKSPPLTFFSQM